MIFYYPAVVGEQIFIQLYEIVIGHTCYVINDYLVRLFGAVIPFLVIPARLSNSIDMVFIYDR